MAINFWDCRYGDYEESCVDGEESCYFMCNHPKLTGDCILSDDIKECALAERRTDGD